MIFCKGAWQRKCRFAIIFEHPVDYIVMKYNLFQNQKLNVTAGTWPRLPAGNECPSYAKLCSIVNYHAEVIKLYLSCNIS